MVNNNNEKILKILHKRNFIFSLLTATGVLQVAGERYVRWQCIPCVRICSIISESSYDRIDRNAVYFFRIIYIIIALQ